MRALQLREYLLARWQDFVAYAALFIVLLTVMAWKLNTLVPGYSQAETQAYTMSLHPANLINNPINAPFFLVTKAILYLHPDSYLAVRLASVGIGFVVLISFICLLNSWQGKRTAIIGGLLFGLSAWFLQNTRLGTPDVLYFGVFLLAACGFWLKKTGSNMALIACFIVGSAILYVPGLVWFIAVGIAWQWKAIDRVFKRHLIALSGVTLLFIAAITPIVFALSKHHTLIRLYFGLPSSWPSLIQVAKNLINIPGDLFLHNAPNAALWLGTAPILDIFSITMLVLGGYLYLRHIRLIRTSIFMSIFVITIVLIAIGSPVTLSTIMPFIYILIAAGVSYFLDMWLKVFPRNPIARSIGWALISALLILVFGYHLKQYFVGWPQAAATHLAFTHVKPPVTQYIDKKQHVYGKFSNVNI